MLYQKPKKIKLCCCPNHLVLKFKAGDYKHSMQAEKYIRYAVLFFFGMQVVLTMANVFTVNTQLS